MSSYRNLYFIETVLNIENVKIRVCVDEHIFASGKECIATTHNHSFYEIRYFASGSGEIVIEDRHFEIFPGALYMIHPNEYHYQEQLSINEGISQFSIRFTPVEPSENASKNQNRAYNQLCEAISSLKHIKDVELTLLPYFERLVGEIHERRYGNTDCITAMLTLIMTDILRRSELNDKKHRTAHTDDFILETDSFFSREYSKKVTLADYAKELNISTRHASRVIRKNFGMSFLEKLTETRIEHAKVALSSNSLPLGEIALKCGFQSYGYFITCFKKQTGMTPAQYRSKNK